MKGIFFTIAALFLMSVNVTAKGEASKQMGAPTGYPDKKPITPVVITYDDDEAEKKAAEDSYGINTVLDPKLKLLRIKERIFYVRYFERMGDENPTSQHNLNYGNNTRLAPIHGSIR